MRKIEVPMTPDSRRGNPKPVSPRPLHVSADPTIRDLRTSERRTDSPVTRLLPWMGLILFYTGAVFQAGRLVERLDPQPQHKPALITELLAAEVVRNAPGTAATPEKVAQAAAEAEAKARALEIQLATKTAELQEARLRAENELLRAELERERASKDTAKVAEAAEDASARDAGTELNPEPTPLPPASVMEPPASPEPAAPDESKPTALPGGAPAP
jgi:hypothetical protein